MATNIGWRLERLKCFLKTRKTFVPSAKNRPPDIACGAQIAVMGLCCCTASRNLSPIRWGVMRRRTCPIDHYGCVGSGRVASAPVKPQASLGKGGQGFVQRIAWGSPTMRVSVSEIEAASNVASSILGMKADVVGQRNNY